jgi:EmrB/QacA subfamily drug resistance transporter
MIAVLRTPCAFLGITPAGTALMKLSEWKVFLYTSVGVLLVFSNMTTMDVALPSIVRYFHASPTQGNWILLGYMLTSTVMILAFGRLADIWGRKTLYLAGMAVFTVASLGCGMAWSADALIVFRIVQAVGAAAVVTNTTALLVDAYPPHRMALVLGLNVSIAAGASILGPLIGGALVSWLGWRALFLAGVPLGLYSLIAGFRILQIRTPAAREEFDLAGAVLSLLALGGLVMALTEGGTLGWGSAEIIACFGLALVAGFAFVQVQLRRAHPLIDLAILKNPDLVLAYYANFMMALVQMATLLLISLFLQAGFGMNALDAGIHITPLAGGLMVSTAIAAKLIGRVPPQRVAAAGMAIITVGLLGMAFEFSGRLDEHVIMALMATIGVGVGLFMTPNTTSIMSSVSAERRGIANGLRSMMQNMGFVVGTALSLAIVTAPLDGLAKRAVYAGQSTLLTHQQLSLFQGEYRVAFYWLAGFACSAVLACLMRAVPSGGEVRMAAGTA